MKQPAWPQIFYSYCVSSDFFTIGKKLMPADGKYQTGSHFERLSKTRWLFYYSPISCPFSYYSPKRRNCGILNVHRVSRSMKSVFFILYILYSSFHVFAKQSYTDSARQRPFMGIGMCSGLSYTGLNAS